MSEPSGWDDDFNDHDCLGDVECGNPLCVAERLEAMVDDQVDER